MAYAASLGETVLEEVVAERTEAEARSLAEDVGFVDDDDDVVEEEIEDFGLDDIKVPVVDLAKTDFPRRPRGETDEAGPTEEDFDDAGVVDAVDEDKSPPDEGRS